MRNIARFVGSFDKSNTVRKQMFSKDFGALEWSLPDWIQQEVFCDEVLDGNYYDSEERKEMYQEMRSICIEAFDLIDESKYDTIGELFEAEVKNRVREFEALAVN